MKLRRLLAAGAAALLAVGVLAGCSAGEQRNYVVLEGELASEEYGIGFKKGNDELREAVQKVFDEMIEDGTAAEISEKWFGKDIVVKP